MKSIIANSPLVNQDNPKVEDETAGQDYPLFWHV